VTSVATGNAAKAVALGEADGVEAEEDGLAPGRGEQVTRSRMATNSDDDGGLNHAPINVG
jgi:hypothetical protein